MDYNIKPVGNRVLVKLIKKEKTSSSGIILTTKDENEQAIGEILAISNSLEKEQKNHDFELKVADKILVNRYAGQEIKENLDGENILKILEIKDILAILTEKN